MQLNWFEYERFQKSLQHKHADMLRDYEPMNESNCKWIRSGEQIIINGILLKRGNFYVGDYFVIPQSYNDKKFTDSIFNNYNRNYKLSRIYGPVIQEDLPIEKGYLIVNPFSSYLDMHPTHRYEYLLWLAEEIDISEVSSSTLLMYLWGLQLRMFIDDSTSDDERLDILKHCFDLYIQCIEDDLKTSEIKLFLNASINYYYKGKELEILNYSTKKDDTKGYQNIINSICRNYIWKWKYKDRIPENLISDHYINNVKMFVESELIKMLGSGKDLICLEEKYLHSIYYSLNRYSGNTMESCICYDLLLNVRLKEEFQICYDIEECIKFFYRKTISDLKDYRLLNKISPTFALLALPSCFRSSDYAEVESFLAFLENKTEGHEYTIVNINDILCFGGNALQKKSNINKTQIKLIINSLGEIGYSIVPNMLINEERFNYGDNCVIYKKTSGDEVEFDDFCSSLIDIIHVVVSITGKTASGSDILTVDNVISKNVKSLDCQRHLCAYLRWSVLSNKPLSVKTRQNIKEMAANVKEIAVVLLARLVSLDANLYSKRFDRLTKILPLFNYKSSDIHVLLHRIITDEEEFATIEKRTDSVEYTIGKNRRDGADNMSLDNEKLTNVERATVQVQDILSKIFDDNEIGNENVTMNNNNSIINILTILFTKGVWERHEVETLCKERNLMIGSILEQINDYSYSKIDDAVIEDDGETIYVTTEYKDQLI